MPKREPEGALYVRLPAAAADKLDRASDALGIAKKDLVAGLVEKYVDPDTKKGLHALTDVVLPRRGPVIMSGSGPTLGAYSFQAYPPEEPAVMTLAQTAALLQLDEKNVRELAEAGKLPGRKIGPEWRFSRAAVLAWLEPQ